MAGSMIGTHYQSTGVAGEEWSNSYTRTWLCQDDGAGSRSAACARPKAKAKCIAKLYTTERQVNASMSSASGGLSKKGNDPSLDKA